MPVNNEVSVQEIIDSVLAFNGSALDQLIALMDKLETDLMSAEAGSLQGEIEELLRTILDSIIKTIEAVLAMQEAFQTRLVESYLPAQD